MKPSIGRIVHLVDGGGKCLAAIITEVGPDHPETPELMAPVALTVFPGAINVSPVSYSHENIERTWHWPEREGS